jgi:hypothetical protein
VRARERLARRVCACKRFRPLRHQGILR